MLGSLSLSEKATLLGEEFALRAEEFDRTGAFPHDNFARLREAGFLALTAPKEFGGGGASLAQATQVIRAIGQGEPSTALILVMQYFKLAALPLGRWPRPVIERVLGDAVASGALINGLRVEPELGTPMRGGLPKTTAHRADGGWRISGRKIYATGAPGLVWGAVWAKTDEEIPRVGSFLVPLRASGVSIDETWNPLGMRASASHDVVFDDVWIPAQHAVDVRAPADWAEGEAGEIVWISTLIGALYTGIAQAARNWVIQFLHDRRPTNLGASLATLPHMQRAIGEIDRLIVVNDRLLTTAARDTDEHNAPSGLDCGLIKITVTENAIAAVEKAVQLTGNRGYSRSNPLERHLRDVLSARIHSPHEDFIYGKVGRKALAL